MSERRKIEVLGIALIVSIFIHSTWQIVLLEKASTAIDPGVAPDDFESPRLPKP